MRADDASFRITVESGHTNARGVWRSDAITRHRITMTTDDKQSLYEEAKRVAYDLVRRLLNE